MTLSAPLKHSAWRVLARSFRPYDLWGGNDRNELQSARGGLQNDSRKEHHLGLSQ